jgi:hypothetical protein
MAENLLDVFLGERADDEGNAQCVWAATEGRFLHVDAWGWLTWTGSHWTSEGAEPALDRAVVATLKQRWSAAIDAGKDAIHKACVPDVRRVNGAKQLFRSLVSASIATFDAAPDALNVANGVLNLRTGALAAHNPTQRFTYCVPVRLWRLGGLPARRAALGRRAAAHLPADGRRLLVDGTHKRRVPLVRLWTRSQWQGDLHRGAARTAAGAAGR